MGSVFPAAFPLLFILSSLFFLVSLISCISVPVNVVYIFSHALLHTLTFLLLFSLIIIFLFWILLMLVRFYFITCCCYPPLSFSFSCIFSHASLHKDTFLLLVSLIHFIQDLINVGVALFSFLLFVSFPLTKHYTHKHSPLPFSLSIGGISYHQHPFSQYTQHLSSTCVQTLSILTHCSSLLVSACF